MSAKDDSANSVPQLWEQARRSRKGGQFHRAVELYLRAQNLLAAQNPRGGDEDAGGEDGGSSHIQTIVEKLRQKVLTTRALPFGSVPYDYDGSPSCSV